MLGFLLVFWGSACVYGWPVREESGTRAGDGAMLERDSRRESAEYRTKEGGVRECGA